MLLLAIALLLAQTAAELQSAAESFSKLCPSDPEACYLQGRALTALGRYEDARGAFDSALRNAPRDLRARAHRAAALNFIGLNQPREAEMHFREAVRLYRAPGEDPRIDYGAFLVREGRIEGALPLLRAAANADPKSARVHAELGKALLYSGDVPEAISKLERALALDPRTWTLHLLLGRAYLEAGRASDAERELKLGRQGWEASQKH